jgi:hypothetical protein
VTVVCPQGHASETTDYCDQCGAPIAAPTVPPAPSAPVATPEPVAPAAHVAPDEEEEEFDTSPAALAEPCPVCLTPRTGNDRFCEVCRYNFETRTPTIPPGGPAPPAGPPGVLWEARVSADQGQFERVGAGAGLTFPANCADRTVPLDSAEITIGRSRAGAPSTPAIDLANGSDDPGVSHMHAALRRQSDGSYAIVDLGSTNGTTLNDRPATLTKDEPVPLADGDEIHLGAWTLITVHRR